MQQRPASTLTPRSVPAPPTKFGAPTVQKQPAPNAWPAGAKNQQIRSTEPNRLAPVAVAAASRPFLQATRKQSGPPIVMAPGRRVIQKAAESTPSTPSSASTLPSQKEISSVVQAIVAKIRETDQEPMICDNVAAQLQEWLGSQGYKFKPWLYSTYNPASKSAMQCGEIYFNGRLIGHDSHIFTEVFTSEGWLVFDNISVEGIKLADLDNGLSFYWAHSPEGAEISISIQEIKRVQVPAKTIRQNSLRLIIKKPKAYKAKIVAV